MANKTLTLPCPSRLEEVRSYNKENPYPIGLIDGSGIVKIEGDLIYYKVDHINYVSSLSTGETTYSITFVLSPPFTYERAFIVSEEALEFLEEELPLIDLDRPYYSIFRQMHEISNMRNLAEIEEHAAGYFTIHKT